MSKNEYDKLVFKVNVIDTKVQSTSRLIYKTQYDSQNQNLEIKKRLSVLRSSLYEWISPDHWLQHKSYI